MLMVLIKMYLLAMEGHLVVNYMLQTVQQSGTVMVKDFSYGSSSGLLLTIAMIIVLF